MDTDERIEHTYDLAGIIDPVGGGACGARDVERGERCGFPVIDIAGETGGVREIRVGNEVCADDETAVLADP